MAAQALRTGATLVTANVAEFARVHGLAWEDWTATS
jgi:predicted nucleic acid-binding protein